MLVYKVNLNKIVPKLHKQFWIQQCTNVPFIIPNTYFIIIIHCFYTRNQVSSSRLASNPFRYLFGSPGLRTIQNRNIPWSILYLVVLHFERCYQTPAAWHASCFTLAKLLRRQLRNFFSSAATLKTKTKRFREIVGGGSSMIHSHHISKLIVHTNILHMQNIEGTLYPIAI